MTGQENQTETEVPEEQSTAASGNDLNDISELLESVSAPKTTSEKSEEEAAKASTKVPAAPESKTKDDGVKKEEETPPEDEPAKEESKTKEAEPSLKDVLKEVLAESRQEAKPAEEKKEPPKEEPKYRPTIPDELFAALESEDPAQRRAGVSAMIGGAMNRVYSDLAKEMRASMQQIVAQMPQVIQSFQRQQDEVKAMHDTFYADNPNFGASPKFKQLVSMVAIQEAQKLGKEYKGFTKEFQTHLAKTIEELTSVKAGKLPSSNAPPKVPPKSKSFDAGKTTTRSEQQPSLSDEIMDIVQFH